MAPGGFFVSGRSSPGGRCHLPCRQDLTQNSHPLAQSCCPAAAPRCSGQNLIQKLHPSPVFRAFPPYQPGPYTKTAASPAAVPFRPSDTLHKNCSRPVSAHFDTIPLRARHYSTPGLTQKLHPFPTFPHVFTKSVFFALRSPKSSPSPSLFPRSSCFLAPADPSEPGSLHKNASLRPPSPLVRMMEQDRKKFWRLLHGCV